MIYIEHNDHNNVNKYPLTMQSAATADAKTE